MYILRKEFLSWAVCLISSVETPGNGFIQGCIISAMFSSLQFFNAPRRLYSELEESKTQTGTAKVGFI